MKTMFTFLLILIASSLFAQYAIKPASIGVHYSYTDFTTTERIKSSTIKNLIQNGQWAIPSEMMMGLGIDFFKGLTQKIDFEASFNYAHGINGYQLLPSNLISYPLYSLEAQLNIKMLTDRYYLRPYISAGAGTYIQNGFGLYLPIGLGLQFNIFNAAILNLQTSYRQPVKHTENANFYYQIGFATALPKKKSQPKTTAPIPDTMMPIIPPVIPEKEIIRDLLVSVLDEETQMPLKLVQVKLIADSNKQEVLAMTDTNGQVHFNAIKSANYTLSGLLNGIATNESSIESSLFKSDNNPIQILLKHHDPRFTLVGKAIDSSSGKPVGAARISIVSNNQVDTVLSNDPDGGFTIQLAASTDYTISGMKNGFISNIEQVSTVGLNRSTTLYVSLNLGIQNARGGKSIVMRNINFETGKSVLNTEQSGDLKKLVQFLQDNPTMNLEISGYTDNVGSEKQNQVLSYNRAQHIVEFLITNKIPQNRLSAKGLGSSSPIASNASEEGRSKNRRVEIKVLD